ncbi:MAG TPA: polynucleotide adenylyltransferase PcnB [Candidatus Saccharimonadia bacterium]|nr:polynucleotide adenylyltransferase PcnB [Candidatus Saccharimonadia bacterium]
MIAFEEHGIERSRISFCATRTTDTLQEHNFTAFVVGGALRDLVLGWQPKDFDVATSATPEQVKQLFRNCRLIGRRFRLAHVMFGGEVIEVATFRASDDDGSGARHMVDGRIVRDNVYGNIEEDAIRRDFTVNALYYTIEDFSVRDFVGGYDDIENRCLRLIGDPESRYREDPVRMLRAIRLAAKLDFTIEPRAYAAIRENAKLIADAAPARLFDELIKLFLSGHAVESFKGLLESGLLKEFLPQTARALVTHAKGSGGTLIDAALANTDERLANDKVVSPAFLLAALLWPAAHKRYEGLVADGLEPQAAWLRASDHVIREQVERMALPRRFTAPMQEIWSMQARFPQAQRKRAGRLMAHPRFRAAYDFFLLRALDEPELAEAAAWWRAQVEHPQDAHGARAPSTRAAAEVADAAEPPARKRRRRRRRKPGGDPGESAAPPEG